MMHNKLHAFKSCCAALVMLAAMTFSACNNADNAPATLAGYTTLEDLEGHTVAVITGSTSDMLLSDTNNFSSITITRCSSPSELVNLVESGGADCGITDTVVLMTLPMQEKNLAVDFNLPGGFDVAVAFDRSNLELCSYFNDFLVQIKSDGTLDDIIERWCASPTDSLAMPDMPELAALQGHPLEIATLADNPPFSFYNGTAWTGLEVEMMLRFSLFIERPVHFSGYNFGEVVDVMRNRQADAAAANICITPERADQVLFSHPYYFCKTSCFSKAR